MLLCFSGVYLLNTNISLCANSAHIRLSTVISDVTALRAELFVSHTVESYEENSQQVSVSVLSSGH